MDLVVLVEKIEAVHFKLLGPSEHKITNHNSLDNPDKGSLQNFQTSLAKFVMFIEENRFERLPIFDISSMEMIVFGFVFRHERCQKFWRLRKW